jgi:hypothetical protein
VPVDARRPVHRLGRVLGVHGVDPAAGDALAHQRPQIRPQRRPQRRGDRPAGHGRRQPCPEQHLVGVDESAPGDDRLVQQQREHRPRAGRQPPVGPVHVGVVAQRVGAQPRGQRRHLVRSQHLAGGGPAQVEPVPIALHAHPDLADRRRRGRLTVGEPAVQSEVDVQRTAVVEVVQQVLPVRLGRLERTAGDHLGPGGEPALRAADPDHLTGEPVPVPGGQAMNGMSFRHRSSMPTADSPTGEWVADPARGRRG